MTSAARYAIGDLARLAGVSRRTVRYYVQENLIAAPLGLGRGNHYGQEHLEQILRVKALQEAGKTLEEVRREMEAGAGEKRRTDVGRAAGLKPRVSYAPGLKPGATYDDARAAPERSIWRRLTLAPGVELQIASNVRLPPPGRLQELAAWCRLHLTSNTDPEDEANDV